MSYELPNVLTMLGHAQWLAEDFPANPIKMAVIAGIYTALVLWAKTSIETKPIGFANQFFAAHDAIQTGLGIGAVVLVSEIAGGLLGCCNSYPLHGSYREVGVIVTLLCFFWSLVGAFIFLIIHYIVWPIALVYAVIGAWYFAQGLVMGIRNLIIFGHYVAVPHPVAKHISRDGTVNPQGAARAMQAEMDKKNMAFVDENMARHAKEHTEEAKALVKKYGNEKQQAAKNKRTEAEMELAEQLLEAHLAKARHDDEGKNQ